MRSRVISGLWGAVAVRSYALARKSYIYIYIYIHTHTHTHTYILYIHTYTDTTGQSGHRVSRRGAQGQ